MRIQTLYIFVVLILAISSCGLAQNVDKEDDIAYKSTLEHANQLFKEGKYLESIIYYKEAQALKPSENLPKYRIEDLKTIYIKKEVDKELTPNSADVASSKSKKELKADAEKRLQVEQEVRERVESEIIAMDNKAVREETKEKIRLMEEQEKMTIATEKRKQAIADSVAREVRIAEAKTHVEEEEKRLREEISKNNEQEKIRVAEAQKKEEEEKVKAAEYAKDQAEVEKRNKEIAKLKEEAVARLEKEEEEKKKILAAQKKLEEENKSKEPIAKEPIDNVKPIASETKTEIENPKEPVNYAKAKAVVQEELKQKYTEPKTVEIIEAEGKKTTRVVMNQGGEVQVYLKVEHAWGGTFYFIDYSPEQLISISSDYFGSHTTVAPNP